MYLQYFYVEKGYFYIFGLPVTPCWELNCTIKKNRQIKK